MSPNKFKILTLIFALAGLSALSTPASAIVQNITPFEWSMPDRLLENTTFPGYDSTSPIPEYDPNALMLPLGGWTVNIDACASSSSTITSYEWFVDGVSVGTVTDCHFSHQFPEEAQYQLSVRLTDDVGDSAVIDKTIIVQDFLIIALGDSYGSGEGNPEKPVTAQAQVDFEVLFELEQNIKDDLQNALDQLPGREEARNAAQQLRDDALVTRDQAAADLSTVQENFQDVLIIHDNVENEPGVTLARNNVVLAQGIVSTRQGVVNNAQQVKNTRLTQRNNAASAFANCSGVVDCFNKSTDLANAEANLAAADADLLAAQTLLATANANLAAAQAALVVARDAAVLIYSAIATLQNFDALATAYDAAQLAINAAQNTFNAAQNAFNNAANALQQAVEAIASLQSIIEDTRAAWEQAKLNAKTRYLDRLPVWTSTPPSWGTPEPTFADIILDDAIPGEALRCHRSMLSGQARAALALEQSDPHTSVTLVHLSCSGGTIAKGLNDTMPGTVSDTVIDPLLKIENLIEPIFQPPPIKAQLDAALDKIEGREVDAMVISIGGNDIQFSDILDDCIKGQPCHEDVTLPPDVSFDDALAAQLGIECNPVKLFNQLTGLSFPVLGIFPFNSACLAAYDLVDNTIDTTIKAGDALHTFDAYMYGGLDLDGNLQTSLATKMQELNEVIKIKFGDRVPERVYITEVPNATGDDLGNHCGWDPSQPPEGDGLKFLPGFTQAEAAWGDMSIMTALHDQTETAAALNLWTFVTNAGDPTNPSATIGSISKTHGYCADDHWMIRIPESLINQQDINGTMHPNRKGHALYAQAIFSQLVSDLYPSGLNAPPRAPALPPAHIPPVNNPPSISDLIFPADGETGVSTTLTFHWNDATDPDGDTVSYEIIYCDNTAFTGCTATTVASIISQGIYIAGIGTSGTLLIGFIGSIFGSNRRRIKDSILVVVIVVASSLLLACGGGGGSDTNTGNNPAPITSDESFTVSGLASNTTYYWKVIAVDKNGGRTESVVRSFTTQ